MPGGKINAGELNIDATASIGLITASFIDANTVVVGTIKPVPGQGSVIIEGNDPCCVYVTGSNSNEAIATSSIEPKHTTHDNQGQCSVINGGNLHSIDTNTQYGGIQSGYSSSLSQQCASNIAGGYQNKIREGVKGRVPGNSIGGGFNNIIIGGEYSTILGGRGNCIEEFCDAFVMGSNICVTSSCTSFVNHLNIKNVDDSQPTDQLLVRHSSGLVRQGPTITEVSGSGTDTIIQVPGLVNPDRDVYVTGSNSVAAIATSSIQPFFMPNNTNNGACSVISSGENNSIVSNVINTSPSYSGIFSGEGNYISGSDYSSIETGEGNYIDMTGSLSASVDYSNGYAKYHTIQNGENSYIQNLYASFVRTQKYTGNFRNENGDLVFTHQFNNAESNPYFSQFIFDENLRSIGSQPSPPDGSNGSGSLGVLSPSIPILNFHNIIQGGENHVIWNNASFNFIGNGKGHRISSRFFGHRYADGPEFCPGGRLYFKPATYNFIGNGLNNKIRGASYSGITAGKQNCIEFDQPDYTDNYNDLGTVYTAAGDAQSFIGAGQCNKIGMTKNSAIGAGFKNRIVRPGGCGFIGAGTCNKVGGEYQDEVARNGFVGAGSNNIGGDESGIVAGYANKAQGNKTFIGSGQNNCISLGQHHSIVGGKDNTIYSEWRGTGGVLSQNNGFIGGGVCNTINYTGMSSIVGGENNTICSTRTNFGQCRTNHASILGGCNNLIKGSRYGAILGGRDNCIQANKHNVFLLGSFLTGSRSNTTFMQNLDTCGDVDFELSCIPTSDVGLRTGQVYRTGSAFDELRIKL